MRFHHPEFLWALLTLLIPLFIHLFNFRATRKIFFSNVRFLKAVEQTSSSARKLKRLLLLTFRMLALTFIVFAFARPYIPLADTGVEATQQLVEIYVDNSFSMEMPGKEGALLEEAKRKARELASAYGINARFRLLTNDLEGRHMRFMDYEDFLNAVDEVKPSAVYRPLHELLAARKSHYSSSRKGMTLILLSDFQKNMLNGKSLKPDSSLQVHCIYLRPIPQPNVSVDSVWFTSPVHKPGDREELVVQLKNHSDKEAHNIPLTLSIDGEERGVADVTVGKRATVRDTFSFSGLTAGWKKGRLSIRDHPMSFDDDYFFAFDVRETLPLLIVNSMGQNRYLSAIYAAEPFFRPQQVEQGQINYGELRNYPLLILNEVTAMSGAFAQQMARYVQAGGHLMVFPSPGDLAGLKLLCAELGTDQPQGFIEREMVVTRLHFDAPFFQGVFEEVPRNVELPRAKRFLRYGRSPRLGPERLLDLADGTSFLSRYSVGKGKVYLSAVELKEEASNFVRHSLFVPVMYRSALLSATNAEPALLIGRDTHIDLGAVSLPSDRLLALKKGGLEIIPDLRQTENATQLFIADQVTQAGHYDILNGDSLIALAAFNTNRIESDLSYISERELQQAFPDNKPEVRSADEYEPADAIKGRNNGVQLWKLCLILALVFLAAEVVLLNLYSRQDIKLNK